MNLFCLSRLWKLPALCVVSAVRLRWSAALQRRPERQRRQEQTLSCWTTSILRYSIVQAWFVARVLCQISSHPVLHPSDLQGLHAAAQALKQEFPSLMIEASGGVIPENLSLYFSPHVDIISLGCITQGCPVVDFSLKVQKPASQSKPDQ